MKNLLMVKVCADNEMLWCYGYNSEIPQLHGVSSPAYYEDGTINEIKAALQLALDQLDFTIVPIINQEGDFPPDEDAMEKYLTEIRDEAGRYFLEEEACQK